MADAPNSNISRRNPKDDYQLKRQVGRGAYGDVYKAIRVKDRSFSAVKIIKLEPGDDFSKIEQEILMMESCRHPNIVAYFGSYLRHEELWICMEYCGGGSLKYIYSITGPFSELQIAYACRETLKGLKYLHSLGMIHRDIKGANILLTDDGDVKLADFGVSAQITATNSKRKTVIGTLNWMAPEVVAAPKGKGGYNQQCDIWAVGITSIELAECQHPVFYRNTCSVLFDMSESGFNRPSLNDKMKWSQVFHKFVEVSLTKNPKERPTAERLLLHPFVQGNLTKQLAKELLDRVNNPQDDDGILPDVPQRITSKKPTRNKQRTKSELHMESVNFDPPLMTALSTSVEQNQQSDVSEAWGISEGAGGTSGVPGIQQCDRAEPWIQQYNIHQSGMPAVNQVPRENNVANYLQSTLSSVVQTPASNFNFQQQSATPQQPQPNQMISKQVATAPPAFITNTPNVLWNYMGFVTPYQQTCATNAAPAGAQLIMQQNTNQPQQQQPPRQQTGFFLMNGTQQDLTHIEAASNLLHAYRNSASGSAIIQQPTGDIMRDPVQNHLASHARVWQQDSSRNEITTNHVTMNQVVGRPVSQNLQNSLSAQQMQGGAPVSSTLPHDLGSSTYSLFNSPWPSGLTMPRPNKEGQHSNIDPVFMQSRIQSLWSGPGPSPLERLLEQQKQRRDGATQ